MKNNEKIKIIFNKIIELESDIIYESCPSDLNLENEFECSNMTNTEKCVKCWKRVLDKILEDLERNDDGTETDEIEKLFENGRIPEVDEIF